MRAVCCKCGKDMGSVGFQAGVSTAKEAKSLVPLEYRAVLSFLPKDLLLLDMIGPALMFTCNEPDCQ